MYRFRSRVVFIFVSVFVALYVITVWIFLFYKDGNTIPWLVNESDMVARRFIRCKSNFDKINRTFVDKFISKRSYMAPYCSGLLKQDSVAYQDAKKHMKNHFPVTMAPIEYSDFIDCFGCDNFQFVRKYRSLPPSKEEENFPIAFGVSVYKDIEQVERLLRMIYAPQNFYCFHIDNKTAPEFTRAMEKIADCFPNVIIASQRFNVIWGTISVLDADLQCMKDLLDFNVTWKYYINLTGQEMPLISNRQLVRVLKAMNGTNQIYIDRDSKRWAHRWKKKKLTIPHQLKLAKGEIHLIADRRFTEFITRNPVAIDLYNWLRDTEVPDESFYSTLNSYQKDICVPGAHSGTEDPNQILYFRWKIWTSYKGHPPCNGTSRRGICIHGIGDIGPMINETINHNVAFMNKMYHDFEYLAFDCMEQYLTNLTNKDRLSTFTYETNVTDNLSYVKNKRVC